MEQAFFKDKHVVITGACGTVGRKLIEHLVHDYDVGSLTGLDNNESELFFLEQKYKNHENLNFFLADIRDVKSLKSKFKKANVVFHTAAFKHVGLCEHSPFEAVQTNILGVQNVVEASYSASVDIVIFTSSDKAVNPTNVMGTSKLMGERLMSAANGLKANGHPIFASTRFGNVLGSRGSVIPLFRDQILGGGPVTITDSQMSRFIMSIDEASRLVIDSAIVARGGEVFVTKMPVVGIGDLADVMIEELAPQAGYAVSDIRTEIIGSRPGEKLYEELMSSEEVRRAVELKDYFAVIPAFKGYYSDIDYEYPDLVSNNVEKAYNSEVEPKLDKSEIRDFLHNSGLI